MTQMKTKPAVKAATSKPGADETLVAFGGTVKALGDGKFRAPLITFSDASSPDLTGDYFTAKTDFWKSFPDSIPLIYAHGQDPVLKSTRLGVTGKATLSIDDSGVWMEGQLDLANEYQSSIYGIVEAGKMGTSSGSAGHIVEKSLSATKDGKSAWEITSWPLVEASLTPTPAEPRNTVVPMKSLKSSLLGMFGTYYFGDDYDYDGDWDPAQEMTRAAAYTLHDRLCRSVCNIITAEDGVVPDKAEAIAGVIDEYRDLIVKAVVALLAALPADDDTAISFDALDAAKALLGQHERPETIRDFEKVLRDANFSRKEAAAIASTGFKSLLRDAEEEKPNGLDAIKAQLQMDALRLESKSLSLKTAAFSAISTVSTGVAA